MMRVLELFHPCFKSFEKLWLAHRKTCVVGGVSTNPRDQNRMPHSINYDLASRMRDSSSDAVVMHVDI